MLKATLTVLTLAAALVAWNWATAPPAACQGPSMCPNMTCVNSGQCGSACICIVPWPSRIGSCQDVSAP